MDRSPENAVTFQDAKKVTRSIVKALNPLSVILFGSVARDGKGTDMDLLIVTHDQTESFRNSDILLHRCLKKYYHNFSIDPFVVPISKLNRYYSEGSPFLKMISENGRMMYMKDAVQEWIRHAGEELDTAEYLLKGNFFKGACFHSQQSVEKSVKARLLRKGWTLEKTHNIRRLIAIAKEYKIRLTLSDEELIFIDSIYIGRYPADAGLLPLGEPTESDAEKAIGIAKRLFKNLK